MKKIDNLLKNRYKKQLIDLIDMEENAESLRKFFKPSTQNFDVTLIKCALWCHYFMPNYFSSPTPDCHYDLMNRFFRAGNDYTAFPRGFGKTTCIQGCIGYSCANGLDDFIVLIEKSFNEASEVLESVREEFKRNPEILRVYGDLTKVNAQGQVQDNIRDSIGDFFIGGIRLRAKGFDAPIRGLKSRHSRPTRIILDDIESDEHIDNVEQRRKYLNNYVKGVIPSIDNEVGKIKMFGTILHDDSLLNTLIKNHEGQIYAAWDKDKNLLWPSKWPVDKLEKKRKEMRIAGKGDSGFYQEYFNEPMSQDDQIFTREMFRYFKELDLEKIKEKQYRIYTLVDPAISKKQNADFTVVITVLVDSQGRIFILEITRDRLDPLETIKTIFAHYEKWRPIFVGIETTAYQKALKYFINEQKLKENSAVQTMVVKEINPITDKVTKIKKLQPKYGIANVFHNSDDQNTPVLEQELLRFPIAAHDDIIDALSNVIEIMLPESKALERDYQKVKKNLNVHTHRRRAAY